MKILCLIFLLSFCPHAFADQPTLPKAPYLLSQEVRTWQKTSRKELVLVDVRDHREYKAGHIPNAINVPYDQIEKRAKKFRRDKKSYVFYCIYSAWRAPYAANVLADLGYNNVYVLQGGLSAWNAGGQIIYPNGKTALDAAIKIAPYPPGLPKVLQHPKDRVYTQQVDLTEEELARYNGLNGQPAYVALDGVIYDVTQSRLWRAGTHDPSEGLASAGKNLTEVFKKHAPHSKGHLKRFPAVGRLVEK